MKKYKGINSQIINERLFEKYCQSQNYYYTRDINDILSDATTKGVIRYKDWNCYDEEDEYLKRSYKLGEYPSKIALLAEYYKFHSDIARIFQEPVASMLNKYYDKKRKYEYYRIAKLIEDENKKNPHKPPKGIVGDKPSPLNSQESNQNNEEEQNESNLQNIQILKELSWLNQLQQHGEKSVKIKHDVSQTLNEICKQMGNYHDQSSLFIPQNVKSEEMKLENFLTYLNKKQINQKKYTSQPSDQLIQSLLQLQQPKNQSNIQKKIEINYLLKTQNNEYPNNKNYNFIKNSIDYLNRKQAKNKISIDEMATKIDSRLSESLKQKPKSQLITNQINNKNASPTAQFNSKITIGSFANIKTQQSQPNQNKNYIAKLLIEDEQISPDTKWKNGALTHRPISGTQNFFNSDRNSPFYKKVKSDNFKFQKAKTQHQYNNNFNSKNLVSNQPKSRKTTSQNIHVRQSSNQERFMTFHNNDINEYKNKNARLLFQDLKQSSCHKKHFSDSRGLHNKEQLNDLVCLTERGSNFEFLLKNNQTQQCSPKGHHFKKMNSGTFNPPKPSIPLEKGTLIQQMIIKVAKQNQQKQINNNNNNKITYKHS
ncbi:unnamed protein product (macronuclear) [Paramecium tetraurelia]|uniref:Uncharacterized protein n=1 Tax=Paramecium tetraurelia TaxID=5888 RepID=A0CAZ9_PARTE|nr:uncharacterized protein GSPATT00036749001 [Paramecium tetraurelia]CAK67966.1 unnamed protein product [Paramecium tetraurelia]|eukprot:XP_001435363.1 hypothetical protein (macronuclear) [Paramecium tetraurelia strain d4-2]